MKHCTLCQRYVEPTKKFSWAIFLLGILTFGIVSIIYLLWYLFIASKKYCPICSTTKLVKLSPEDEAKEKQEKIEKKEARKEMMNNVTEKVKETVSNKLE